MTGIQERDHMRSTIRRFMEREVIPSRRGMSCFIVEKGHPGATLHEFPVERYYSGCPESGPWRGH